QQYRGVPVFSEEGNLSWVAPDSGSFSDVRMALFFDTQGLNMTPPDQWVEQTASSFSIPALSPRFLMNCFAWPGPEHMVKRQDGSWAGFGIARILAYRDENQDGRYQPEEPLVGIAGPQVYLYLPAPFAAEQTPFNVAFDAGLHRLFLPQLCGYAPPPPTLMG